MKKTKSRSQKSKNRKYANKLQRGGSPASTLVMRDTMNPPVMNDYVTSPRIREPWYDGSLSSLKSHYQSGGSPASDLVMNQLTDSPVTQDYPNGWKVQGDMNSLNLYATTGGARRKRSKSKRKQTTKNSNLKSKSKSNTTNKKKNSNYSRKNKNKNKNRSRNNKLNQRGGSDWISSQYSLGPNNYPEATTSMFSHSGATPRSDYMNPASLGLAGSGYPMGSLEGANVQHMGAPLV